LVGGTGGLGHDTEEDRESEIVVGTEAERRRSILPGALVGVLRGGGTALNAGAAQVLVLIGLLAAQAITTASLLRLIATGRVVRGDLRGIYPR
jgi:hypothetical protein